MEKKLTLEEGNRIIAGFDPLMEGFDPTDPKRDSWVRSGGLWVHKKDLRYHTSWDWLMPVVEKIETENGIGVDINQRLVCVPYAGITISGQDKITAVWKSVVQFIQWLNQNREQ